MKRKRMAWLLAIALCCGNMQAEATQTNEAARRLEALGVPTQSPAAVDKERAEWYYRMGLKILPQKDSYRRDKVYPHERIKRYSYNYKEYTFTEKAFEKALRANQMDARFHLERGKIAQRIGNEIKRNFIFSMEELVFVYMLGCSNAAIQKQLKEGSPSRDFQFVRAIPEELTKQYSTALQSYKRALALDTEGLRAAEIFRWRGAIYGDLAACGAAMLRFERMENNRFSFLNLLEPKNPAPRLSDAYEALLKKTATAVERNFAKALQDCDEALRLNPADADAYAVRGAVYYNRGRYRLEAAGAPSGYWSERFVRQVLPEGKTCDLADYTRAIADYKRALALLPEKGAFWLELGRIYESAYKDAQALAAYSRALKQPETRKQALYERAKLHLSLGQLKEADKDMSVYMAGDKNISFIIGATRRVDGFTNRMEGILAVTDKIAAAPETGMLYEQRAGMWIDGPKMSSVYKDYTPQALADYDQAEARGVRTAALYWNRGECYRALGQLPQALADYERAEARGYIKDASGKMVRNFYFCRAKTLALLGQYRAAISDYTQALKQSEPIALDEGDVWWIGSRSKVIAIRADTSTLYWERGQCYRQLDLLPQALDDYEKAKVYGYFDGGKSNDLDMKFHSYNESVLYLTRAKVRTMQHQYEEAAADYTRLLRQNKAGISLYFDRSDCYEKAGKYHLAAADLHQVLLRTKKRSLQKEQVMRAYQRLAKLYADDLHDDSLALEAFDALLRLSPKNDGTRLRRALLLDRMGEEAKAAEDFHLLQKDEKTRLHERIPEKYRLPLTKAQEENEAQKH